MTDFQNICQIYHQISQYLDWLIQIFKLRVRYIKVYNREDPRTLNRVTKICIVGSITILHIYQRYIILFRWIVVHLHSLNNFDSKFKRANHIIIYIYISLLQIEAFRRNNDDEAIRCNLPCPCMYSTPYSCVTYRRDEVGYWFWRIFRWAF